MARQQRWTAVVSTGLMVGALLACKKKPDAAAEASATASAPAAPATTAAPAATSAAPAPTPEAPAAAEAKLGDVKRYGVEKESKLDDAGVRVTADELKVYNEADTSTDDVATLPKGLLVFRQVKMDTFTLVEFPSGVGQFSQGWVETKALSDSPEKVTRSAALSEKKTATVKVTDGGTPATDGGKADDKKADAGADKKTDTKADAGADKKTDTKTASKTDTKSTDTKTDTKKTDTKTETKKTDSKSTKVAAPRKKD